MHETMTKLNLDAVNSKYSNRDVVDALILEFGTKHELVDALGMACLNTNLLVPRNHDSEVSGSLNSVWSSVLEHEFRILTKWPCTKIVGIFDQNNKEKTRTIDFFLRTKEIPIELKGSRTSNSPTIKRENIGNYVLFVKFDDKRGALSAGVVRAKEELLNPGKNSRDTARAIKKEFMDRNCYWFVRGHRIPHARDSEISEMQREYLRISAAKLKLRFEESRNT